MGVESFIYHLRFRRASAPSKLPEQIFPDAASCPAHKAIMNRCRGTILGRAVAPATAAFQCVHDAADAIVNAQLR
jgi:hypothetical protein